MTRDDILAILDERRIPYREFCHEAVNTIAEAEGLSIPGFDMPRVPKNLFLRDDKKRQYYLVSIASGKTADLKKLRRILGSRPLSFASEEDLLSILSLRKGSVTPFGLLADREHRTVAVIDSFFSGGDIGIHPMENTSTVFIAFSDLISLLDEFNIEHHIINI